MNYPSLPVNFVKMLPSLTPSCVSNDVLKMVDKSQPETEVEADSTLQTKLNRLKKLNKSLTRENLKLRDASR